MAHWGGMKAVADSKRWWIKSGGALGRNEGGGALGRIQGGGVLKAVAESGSRPSLTRFERFVASDNDDDDEDATTNVYTVRAAAHQKAAVRVERRWRIKAVAHWGSFKAVFVL